VSQKIEYHLFGYMFLLVRKGHSNLPYATGRDAALEKVHGKVKEAHDALQMFFPE
jgi:hypothetical protein